MSADLPGPALSAGARGSANAEAEPRTACNGSSGLVGAGGVSVLNSGQTSFLNSRVLVWFSCGSASACAAKLTLAKYGATHTVEIVNCNTLADEHEDNARFMRDVERWLGVKVKQIASKLYATVDEVNEKTRYMSGPDGARCTTELKKKPRIAYQWAEDLHVWGMTAGEEKRIKEFEWNNPELKCEWVLRDAGMTKEDCHAMIAEAGIEQAAMYRLGFENNNCKGCEKATSPAYWNMTRRCFPETFALRARRSRELGVRLVRLKGVRIFLDELPPDEREEVKEDLSCGPACNPSAEPLIVGAAAIAKSLVGGGGAEHGERNGAQQSGPSSPNDPSSPTGASQSALPNRNSP